ncbi:MAG: GAF domain-containing protein [Anaerolineales bacterium]|nr:GAF domain-containing protein [Anaerolineales bacterium]
MAIDQSKLLARLIEVTRSLSNVGDLETYLQSIISAATELTESETIFLMEYDEAAQELYFKYIPWFYRDRLKDIRLPTNESAAGWVFLHAKPLIINDVKNDDRYYRKLDEITGFAGRSLLGVPLMLHGRPIGVLQVFNKIGDSHYTEEDASVLETLASLAVAAMQNDMLESNVVSSKDESRELDRLKNEFIAITSHELRTPLGLILGHSTFLRELVGKEHYEQVDAIIRNASKLKEIIENLSRMDNYETGSASLRQRKVSVARIIEDVSASFRDIAAQKGVELKIEIERGQEMPIDGDASKIAIALSNLVKNSITFTNEGGHIIIRGELQSDFVKVSVEDNGIGIPTKDLSHVFDRFYQVESHLTRKHGGMGLGLSVAKAMIEIHGGRIWVESTEGLGSKFTFLLPTKIKEAQPDSVQPFAE